MIEYKKDIKEILNNGEYNVQDKIVKLEKLRDTIYKEITKETHKQRDLIRYCPHCNKFYLKKSFDTFERTEMRDVLEDWGEDEYEKKECCVVYGVCPCGHTIELEVGDM